MLDFSGSFESEGHVWCTKSTWLSNMQRKVYMAVIVLHLCTLMRRVTLKVPTPIPCWVRISFFDTLRIRILIQERAPYSFEATGARHS